jgi:hypothetical protein
MRKKTKLVFGVGVNDADYPVAPLVNGNPVWCPFYRAWADMLKRCYYEKYQAGKPTYIGCSVTPEWHSFMAFRSWMVIQDWKGKQLDKDILVFGNKVYAPEVCVFVSGKLNSFMNDHGASRGEWPIGVSWNKRSGKFTANCRNPFTAKQEAIGYFECPYSAHEAWKDRKHKLALQLAAGQSDPRVSKALEERYAPAELMP